MPSYFFFVCVNLYFHTDGAKQISLFISWATEVQILHINWSNIKEGSSYFIKQSICWNCKDLLQLRTYHWFQDKNKVARIWGRRFKEKRGREENLRYGTNKQTKKKERAQRTGTSTMLEYLMMYNVNTVLLVLLSATSVIPLLYWSHCQLHRIIMYTRSTEPNWD